MTETAKVTHNQAKARSIYNRLIKDNIFYTGISKNLAIALIELGIDSSTTDKLSVEKLQEIRVEELKNFNSKILQAELKNQKLQEQFDVVKNKLKESEKNYQKQMDRFLNSEMNETARSHCESQLKLLLPAHKAYEELAAIGNEGSGDE